MSGQGPSSKIPTANKGNSGSSTPRSNNASTSIPRPPSAPRTYAMNAAAKIQASPRPSNVRPTAAPKATGIGKALSARRSDTLKPSPLPPKAGASPRSALPALRNNSTIKPPSEPRNRIEPNTKAEASPRFPLYPRSNSTMKVSSNATPLPKSGTTPRLAYPRSNSTVKAPLPNEKKTSGTISKVNSQAILKPRESTPKDNSTLKKPSSTILNNQTNGNPPSRSPSAYKISTTPRKLSEKIISVTSLPKQKSKVSQNIVPTKVTSSHSQDNKLQNDAKTISSRTKKIAPSELKLGALDEVMHFKNMRIRVPRRSQENESSAYPSSVESFPSPMLLRGVSSITGSLDSSAVDDAIFGLLEDLPSSSEVEDLTPQEWLWDDDDEEALFDSLSEEFKAMNDSNKMQDKIPRFQSTCTLENNSMFNLGNFFVEEAIALRKESEKIKMASETNLESLDEITQPIELHDVVSDPKIENNFNEDSTPENPEPELIDNVEMPNFGISTEQFSTPNVSSIKNLNPSIASLKDSTPEQIEFVIGNPKFSEHNINANFSNPSQKNSKACSTENGASDRDFTPVKFVEDTEKVTNFYNYDAESTGNDGNGNNLIPFRKLVDIPKNIILVKEIPNLYSGILPVENNSSKEMIYKVMTKSTEVYAISPAIGSISEKSAAEIIVKADFSSCENSDRKDVTNNSLVVLFAESPSLTQMDRKGLEDYWKVLGEKQRKERNAVHLYLHTVDTVKLLESQSEYALEVSIPASSINSKAKNTIEAEKQQQSALGISKPIAKSAFNFDKEYLKNSKAQIDKDIQSVSSGMNSFLKWGSITIYLSSLGLFGALLLHNYRGSGGSIVPTEENEGYISWLFGFTNNKKPN